MVAAWYARRLGNERVASLLPAANEASVGSDKAPIFDPSVLEIKYGRVRRDDTDQLVHDASGSSSGVWDQMSACSDSNHGSDEVEIEEVIRPVEMNYSHAEGSLFSLSSAFTQPSATTPAATDADKKDGSCSASSDGRESLGIPSVRDQLEQATRYIEALKAQLREAGLEPVADPQALRLYGQG